MVKAWPMKLKKLLAYGIPSLFSLGILYRLTHLEGADWRIPFAYDGDAAFTLMFINTMIQDGWIFVNQSLSAPDVLNLHDYPLSAESFHLIVIKAMSWIWRDPFLLLNLYYALRFVLTTATALWGFRQLGISYGIATALALMYAFVPHGINHGLGHLFVGTYYIVPLIVVMTVWAMRGEIPWQWRDRKFRLSLLFCAITAGCGLYYAYFACFFLGLAGVYAGFDSQRESLRKLALPFGLSGLIVGTVLLVSSPALLFYARLGKNPWVGQRSTFEAELFGMKIIQLLLPAQNHFIAAFQRKANHYSQSSPLITENVWSTLGVMGAFGVLFLIFWALLPVSVRARAEKGGELYSKLSLLNLLAILLATIGGFGSVIAFFFFPGVRAYNRISVFIAFFSFLAVARACESLRQRFFLKTTLRRWAGAALLVPLVILAILDQVGQRGYPHRGVVEPFLSDRDFAERMMKALPQGTLIYQLPQIPFPEHPPVQKMNDYDHAKIYLHTGSYFRWSYPAMAGRPTSQWQKIVSALPMDEFLARIQARGFGAVYVDRFGYADQGEAILKGLKEWLGEPILGSRDGRRVLFRLNLNLTVQYDSSGEIPKAIRIQNLRAPWRYPKSLRDKEIDAELNRIKTREGSWELKLSDVMVDSVYLENLAAHLNSIDHALPEKAFQSEVICQPTELSATRAGIRIELTVKNHSEVWWPKESVNKLPLYTPLIRSRLYDANMKVIDGDFVSRVSFPRPIRPGGVFTAEIHINHELLPRGTSYVEYDLVQEGVRWAKSAGGKSCTIKILNGN